MFSTNPDGGENVKVEASPNLCPQCHHAVEPKVLQSTLTGTPSDLSSVLEIAFKCTRHACSRMFIGRYQRRPQVDQRNRAIWHLIEAVPLNHRPPDIYPEISTISPSFVQIYEQTHIAEELLLDQIAGVGYRKALEFLIKDFCIANVSTMEDDVTEDSIKKKDSIKNKSLGAVIQDHVNDTNIKVCAERAAWLGNDEAHYVKKWTAKDINDLKILIDLVCVEIRRDVLTKKYMSDMK